MSGGSTTVGGPTAITQPFGPWSALPNLWIQPLATPGPANSGFAAGDYTYTLQFYLPCQPRNYAKLAIGGAIAADNNFTAYLNGNSFLSCSTGHCFGGAGTPIPVSPSVTGPFVQGLNTIKIVVHNNESYTGLAAQLTLNLTCGKECCMKLPTRDEYGSGR
jgi:hypothetical protein